MKGFQQEGNALLWELKHEKLKIVPWGQTITADAPLEKLPLYLRGDADLPIKAEERNA